jgi:hypothetical protein
MAARVAAALRRESGVRVETVRGGFGEFTVLIDGAEAIRSSRFWYPNPWTVLKRVRQLLAASPELPR